MGGDGRAILLGSAMGYGAVITAVISPSVLFAFLVNASGALMLIIYLMVAIAQVRLRQELERTHPERLAIRMWGHPWLTWLVVAVITAVLLSMLGRQSSANELYASLACVFVVVVACVLRLRLGRAVPGN